MFDSSWGAMDQPCQGLTTTSTTAATNISTGNSLNQRHQTWLRELR